MKFLPGDTVKSDVLKGKHFNIVVICLDEGYEIPSHYEPYDVFFYVVSGRGIITAGNKLQGVRLPFWLQRLVSW